MELSSNKCLCSIDVEGSVYFLSTFVGAGDSGETDFTVALLDAATLDVWMGSFGGDIKSKAKVIDMKEAEFIDLSKKALTRQNMGGLEFEYQVSSNKQGGRELSWKKVVSSIKLQLGTVNLAPVASPPEVVKDILLHSIQTVADTKDALYRLKTENDRLSSERTHALKRLEKCVVMKEGMEEDLYAKFAVILNEKKVKIRELKDRASASVDEAGDDEEEGQRSQQTADDVIKQESEEEAMDLDTDEEKEREMSVPKRRKESHEKASTSRNAGRLDDDIVFDEESPEISTSSARRRRREPQVKRTPSTQKPAIPRVTSTGTPSSSGTPSRASSTRSQRSTESDDVEDLINKI